MGMKYPVRQRFTGRMWGAMYQDRFLPGMFVYRTRKDAWAAIMAKVSDPTIAKARARGWKACRLDAVLTVVR